MKRGRPGHRFQDRYERAQRQDAPGGAFHRFASLALAVLCLAIGLVLTLIPGPAIPFLLFAGGLLAVESKPIAKTMDALEVWVRRAWRWLRGRWRRLSVPARVLLAIAVLGVTVGFGYGAFQLASR